MISGMYIIQIWICLTLLSRFAHPLVSVLQGDTARRFGVHARGFYVSELSAATSDQVSDRNSQPSNAKNMKKPTRFIHPQVFKMFQRAQHCMRNGENVVAQRLLYRCLELNP